jgi:hypothetical protein
MLKMFAFIVIAFFTVLWATGNNVQSLKDHVDHWADASAEMTGGPRPGDWGDT